MLDNSTILKKWETALNALPATAHVSAELKTFSKSFRDDKPTLSKFDFQACNPPVLRLDGRFLEKIELSCSFSHGIYAYDIHATFRFDGSVTFVKEYGPVGETPAKKQYSRIYPNDQELTALFSEGDNTDTVFLVTWLEDFATLINSTPRLSGSIKLYPGKVQGYNHGNCIDPKTWAKQAIADIRNCSFVGGDAFEAILTRDSAVRDDFRDVITVRIRPGRKIFAEYKTEEKDGYSPYHIAPLILGMGHEANDLKLLSKIFPNGFPERDEKAFWTRYTNLHDNSVEYRPWPNRQPKAVLSAG